MNGGKGRPVSRSVAMTRNSVTSSELDFPCEGRWLVIMVPFFPGTGSAFSPLTHSANDQAHLTQAACKPECHPFTPLGRRQREILHLGRAPCSSLTPASVTLAERMVIGAQKGPTLRAGIGK
jgi:hypothetical protein